MHPCPLLDRDRELETIDKAYSRRPAFLVVYGRRRIGKTRLLREWITLRNPKNVYYLAHLTSHLHNLKLMATNAARQLGKPELARTAPESLGSLLSILSDLGVEVVVIDEITYWARSDPLVLSELQEFIDLQLPETQMLLTVSGSLLGVMKEDILGGTSPLYARSSYRIRLGELPFGHLKCALRKLSPEDRVRAYSLVGGIPYYLCLLSTASSIEEIVELLVTRDSPLTQEKDFVLREEFREPATYNAVLSALAKGYDTPTRISQITGIKPGLANKAAHVLDYLGFIARDVPLFRKKGRYVIVDPILRTWYTLIEPVQAMLELGLEKEAQEQVLSRIDEYTGRTWETLTRAYIWGIHAAEGYRLAGRAVHKGEELDTVIVDPETRRAIIAEAKWSTLTAREIRKIKLLAREKAKRVLPQNYAIEKIYVAAKRVIGEPPEDTITPQDLEEGATCPT